MLAHSWGLKTFYYSLINKAGAKVVEESVGNVVEAVSQSEEDCEACKL
jgi:hypothetical protein